MARKRRRRGRRRGGGAPRVATLKDKGYIGAGAAAYGYVDNHVEFMNKLPTLGTSTTARNASHGLALHFAAGFASGDIRRWLDLMSVGAIAIAGYKVGAAKLDMDALEGDDDVERIHLEGEFDPDEDDIIDDELDAEA